MMWCEELFLLVHRPDGRLVRWGAPQHMGYVFTALTELVERGRVEIDDRKPPRFSVVDATATGEPALDRVLERAAARGECSPLPKFLASRRNNPQPEVVESLTRRGVIDEASGGIVSLGRQLYPLRQPQIRQELTEALVDVITGQGEPDPGRVCLLVTLKAMGVADKVLLPSLDPMTRREMNMAIDQAAQGTAGGDAIRRAVQAMVVAGVAGAVGGS